MKKIGLFLLVSILLVGCTSQPTEIIPSAAVETLAQEASPTALVTLPAEPTETPTPLPPSRALLLAPPGADLALADELEAGLRPALEQAGVSLERLPGLKAAGIQPDVRLVVVLPPDPGVAGLAAAAPQAQFLAVGIPGLQPAANLSLVGAEGRRPDQEGFIAGVVAAMITADWRVGVLSTSDSPEGKAYRQGFLNGAVYFCGLCNPNFGPIVDYPVYAEAAAGASATDWQAAVQALVDSAVQTVYVSPLVTDPAAWEALAAAEMALISGVPLPEGLAERGVVQVSSNPLPAVLELLPRLLAGEGGFSEALPLRLVGANEERFGSGRQQRAQETLADLLAGYIDPGVDLLTGDSK
jgi:hypothetical protein